MMDEHIKKIEWYRTPVKKKLSSFTYFNGWIDGHPIGNMDLNKYKHKRKILVVNVIKHIRNRILAYFNNCE